MNPLQDICMDKKILCVEHAGNESLSHPYYCDWVCQHNVSVGFNYVVLVFSSRVKCDKWTHILFGNGRSQILYTVYRITSNYLQKTLDSIVANLIFIIVCVLVLHFQSTHLSSLQY